MSRKEITVEEAARRLHDFDVVDVREPDEFHGPLGHIAGARLVPFGEFDVRDSVSGSDRPLLIACRSGRRSGILCDRLLEQGFSDAINLTGGMIAWNDAALPVEGNSQKASA